MATTNTMNLAADPVAVIEACLHALNQQPRFAFHLRNNPLGLATRREMTDSYELAAFIGRWLAADGARPTPAELGVVRRLVELYDAGFGVDSLALELRHMAGGKPAEPATPAVAPTATADAPAFTPLQLEACLDVWEALLEARISSRDHALDEPKAVAFARFWEDRGTVEMRLTITPLIADWALAVFDAGRVDNADAWSGFAYDWEVIPAMIADIDWDGEAIGLDSDHAAVCARVLATLNKPRS